MNITEELQADSRKGFDIATKEMISNLKTELENFKVRIKEAPSEFKVEHKPGYTGGGAIDGWFAICLAGLTTLALWRQKR